MSAFDDYLKAPVAPQTQSFDAYMNGGAAAAVPPALRAPQVQTAPPAASQPIAGQPAPLGGFLTGVGDAAKGTTQGIVHGLSWLADKIAPNSQFAQDARAALPQMQQDIDQQNAAYSAQRAANGQTGIDWSRLAGNAVGAAPTMALGPEFAGLSLPEKLGVGALQGAAGAAMMPTTGNSDESYSQQKLNQAGIGAGFGAALPAAFAGTRAVGSNLWNAIKPVVQPGKFVGQGLSGALSPQDAAAAAAGIRSAPEFVPGSVPTTAQVAPNPVLVQTEKAAANANPDLKSALMQRSIDNNNARWQALMGVAQTPEALQAAQTARADAVQPLYDAANTQTTNVGKAFINFAQRPAVQQAMQQADQMARNEGVQLKWPTPDDRGISGQALDYTNRALGDMIDTAKRSGNNQQARALADAQGYLKSWTASYIPEVRQAAQTYAQMSVPINTMEVGQQIANGLGTRTMNAGGAPEIQMMPFRSALTKAMGGADHGIDANALNTLQGIGQDLQRATISNSVRSPGSDTAYNLAANGWLARQLYGPSFQGAGTLGKIAGAAGALVSGHPLAAGGIMVGGNKVGQMVGGRLQQRLGGYLLDPQTLLPYLDARASASAGQSAPGPVVNGLLNYGRPAAVNGLLGGFVNAPQ